jgi:hypothetical protein
LETSIPIAIGAEHLLIVQVKKASWAQEDFAAYIVALCLT